MNCELHKVMQEADLVRSEKTEGYIFLLLKVKYVG